MTKNKSTRERLNPGIGGAIMSDTNFQYSRFAIRAISVGAAALLTLIASSAVAGESSVASGLTVSEWARLMYWDAADSSGPAGDAFYFGEDARSRLESFGNFVRPERGGLRAPAGSWAWSSRFRSLADAQFLVSDVSNASNESNTGSRGSLLDQGSGLARGRPSVFLWQSTRTRDEGTIDYDFGLVASPAPYGPWAGPGFDQQKLGNVALSTRFSIRPRAAEELQTGVFFGYARVPLQGALAAETFKQAVGGAFINWDNDRWRLTGQVSHVTGRFAGIPGRDSFVAALGQAEYRFSPTWTLYGRGELAGIGTEDPYLALYPDFPKSRLTAGMRFDLTRRQALSLEFASGSRFDQLHLNQIDLRWRAEFK